MAGIVEMSDAGPKKPKRFYSKARISEHEDGYHILLDERAAKTKTQKPLHIPSKALAEAVMNEWEGQGDHIDFAEMPLTQLLSTAIDADDETIAFWRSEVVKFLGTDLLCYRADVPKELVDAQTAAWDCYLDWFAEAFGVRLGKTAGVPAIAQPVEAIEQVR